MSKHKLIPYPVIAAAVRGDPEAVNQVLQMLNTPLEPLSADADRWPNADWFKGATTQMEQARAALATAIETARMAFAPSRDLFSVPSSWISVWSMNACS